MYCWQLLCVGFLKVSNMLTWAIGLITHICGVLWLYKIDSVFHTGYNKLTFQCAFLINTLLILQTIITCIGLEWSWLVLLLFLFLLFHFVLSLALPRVLHSVPHYSRANWTVAIVLTQADEPEWTVELKAQAF